METMSTNKEYVVSQSAKWTEISITATIAIIQQSNPNIASIF